MSQSPTKSVVASNNSTASIESDVFPDTKTIGVESPTKELSDLNANANAFVPDGTTTNQNETTSQTPKSSQCNYNENKKSTPHKTINGMTHPEQQFRLQCSSSGFNCP